MRSAIKEFPYTIVAGQTNGPWIGSNFYEDMVAMLIAAPAVLAETIKFEINNNIDGTGTSTTVLQNDTPADIAGPTAGKSRFYHQLVNAVAFRLVASGAVAANRTFLITGQYTD